LVRPIRGVSGDDACGRRDAARVDLLDLIGIRENVAKLTREELDLRCVELEIGERCDFRNLLTRQ